MIARDPQAIHIVRTISRFRLIPCSEGNDAFKKADYALAVTKYSEAIAIDPSNHVYYSNRR